MNTEEYFKSLSDEFASVKDRIRNFIGARHWASDGEWKESVVKSVLRGYLTTWSNLDEEIRACPGNRIIHEIS